MTGRTDPSGFGTPWIGFMIKLRRLASSRVKGPKICDLECHLSKIFDRPTNVSGVLGGLRGKPVKFSFDSVSRIPMSMPSFSDLASDSVNSGLHHCCNSCLHLLLLYFLMSQLWKSLTGSFCSVCVQ